MQTAFMEDRLMSDMKKISDEELENVSGGVIHQCVIYGDGTRMEFYVEHNWRTLAGPFNSLQEAESYIKDNYPDGSVSCNVRKSSYWKF